MPWSVQGLGWTENEVVLKYCEYFCSGRKRRNHQKEPARQITTWNYPDSIICACTILLRAKKIKKFISLLHKGLHHFAKFFTPDFRMKHASLCKGGGATLFAPKSNMEDQL